MDLLVIGGTRFVGRHLVESALEQGHNVTLFNRGQSGADLFPDIEKLQGDRKTSEGLSALSGRRWDAVVDTCGYFPSEVIASGELLKGSVGRYLFISTISVYADFSRENMDEDSPLATTDDTEATEVTGDNYGALKVLCEQAITDIYGDHATIVRPGLVVGPHDPTDRFTYWPARIARGGETLAPGRPQRRVQFIDARDLADFTIKLLEAGTSGTYNANGPAELLPMRELLEICRDVSGSDSTFTWVSDIFLTDRDVAPFTELPLWIPEEHEYQYAGALSRTRSIEHGITFRPLSETVKDTLEWDRSRSPDRPRPHSISQHKEEEILRDWHRLSQPF